MHPFHHFLHARGAFPFRHHHADRHGERHCHGMRRGFSHHGDGRGRDERGGDGLDGFERGRKIGGDELQLLILALLAEQSRHGYELIKEIDQRSGGWYVPSPGMVYPALSYLEDAGEASVELEGTRKRYSLTDAGRTRLEAQRAAVDALWAQLARFGERIARMREDERLGADAPADGRAALHAALHELREALHTRRERSPEQLARVIALLRETAAAIRGGDGA